MRGNAVTGLVDALPVPADGTDRIVLVPINAAAELHESSSVRPSGLPNRGANMIKYRQSITLSDAGRTLYRSLQ